MEKANTAGRNLLRGEHRYFFKAFALDTVLDVPRGAKRQELEKAMQGHVLDEATLMGRYAKQ